MRGREERDGGQATLLLLAVVVLVALTAVAVAQFGRRLHAREQAQVAADAAALAATWGGPQLARQVAAANGAAMMWCRCETAVVTVSVTLDGQHATAHATRAP